MVFSHGQGESGVPTAGMKLVVFGLTISSSWGNGHATLLRALFRQLIAAGDTVVFFERDVPYYAAHRDLHRLDGGRLIFYSDWADARAKAQAELADADAGLVTSYCPDGVAATQAVCDSSAARIFYDMDTPVTLANVRAGKPLSYLGPDGCSAFDLVLSFTGGGALTALKQDLGAQRVAALYGSVDPALYRPVTVEKRPRAAFSYLGTYAADRQPALDRLFIEPARRCPGARFVIGGAQYPDDFPWGSNIFFQHHLAPSEHPAFYCSSRLTLNVTRDSMRWLGWCPSGRLFEAAACGVPIVTDQWMGLDEFFTPGEEILLAETADDVINAMQLGDAELNRIATAARARTLAEHTAARRAEQLRDLLASACRREAVTV